MYNKRAIYNNYYLPYLKPQVEEAVVVPSFDKKISVIMPIMNTCDELVGITQKAIASIRSYPNVELILINNYKEDTTDYHPDKEVTNLENVGVSKAWNQGLIEATGDYIMIVNSDIVLPQGWEQELTKNADKGIVFPWIKDRQVPDGVTEIPDARFMFDYVHGCCFLAHKSIFNKNGMFDERFFAYYEDKDYWTRAVVNGIHAYRANILVDHLMNATSGKMPELGDMIAQSEAKYHAKWG